MAKLAFIAHLRCVAVPVVRGTSARRERRAESGLRARARALARRRRQRHEALRPGGPQDRAEQGSGRARTGRDVQGALRQHEPPGRRGEARARRAVRRRRRLARPVHLRGPRHRRGAGARRDRPGDHQGRDGRRVPRVLRLGRADARQGRSRQDRRRSAEPKDALRSAARRALAAGVELHRLAARAGRAPAP